MNLILSTYLEQYLYKPKYDIPKMVFRRSEEEEWYNFFEQQYQALWNDAKEWTCSQSKASG